MIQVDRQSDFFFGQIAVLPSSIRYEPLHIPYISTTVVEIDDDDELDSYVSMPRRTWRDVESQLSVEPPPGTDVKVLRSRNRAQEIIDSPSDLEPGLYEGGMKTWECSLELAGYLLESIQRLDPTASAIRGRRILEVSFRLLCWTDAVCLFPIY